MTSLSIRVEVWLSRGCAGLGPVVIPLPHPALARTVRRPDEPPFRRAAAGTAEPCCSPYAPTPAAPSAPRLARRLALRRTAGPPLSLPPARRQGDLPVPPGRIVAPHARLTDAAIRPEREAGGMGDVNATRYMRKVSLITVTTSFLLVIFRTKRGVRLAITRLLGHAAVLDSSVDIHAAGHHRPVRSGGTTHSDLSSRLETRCAGPDLALAVACSR